MGVTYTLTSSPKHVEAILDDDDRVFIIPNDPDNMDWRVYQEWLALGNKPKPAPSAPAPSAPTIESLMAEMKALQAKIEALQK
jgi:hypothetical protein